ncbi:MAG: glycosyltransferase family 39 protein [Furfurilactobacillus sp.]|uniref:glycosyltransferase family 39 protein n=1 Tax=Furfurilactobacillus TaxID=2767882 RepID=UPI001F43CA98|nr:glycosyltransferase family 39 protein [Furfurilactobacillus sp.]MCF6419717.1 glycosyltransferase family 39 protein [Furfurilactobacillus milii]MCH4012621.1 glycosyltransferase family 39 protein [Furfurilactobacillus sp.]MCH4036204.1 glycosyltransferase family 39 protein [Furfurilactobacillus sp.]MCH4114850.1 glycosyltransferase family 39 protein [Furfurilactobacillus sp.]MCH4133573.1 glycosyltransferase family 39 protein [Furfurilactobacillus sp.]
MAAITAIIFGVIFFTALARQSGDFGQALWLQPSSLFFMSLTIGVFMVVINMWLGRASAKVANWVSTVVLVIAVAVQVYLAFHFVGIGNTDPALMRLQALNLANGSHHWFSYFAWYPHNVNLTIFLTWIIELFHVHSAVATGYVLNVLNFILIDFTLIMSWRLIRRYVAASSAAMFAILAASFAPFYWFALNFYVDSVAVVIPLMMVVFLNRYFSRQQPLSKAGYAALLGVTFTIGYLIKPNLLIVPIAILIYWLLAARINRTSVVRGLIGLVVFAAIWLAGVGVSHAVQSHYGYHVNQSKTLPTSAWTAMGLNQDSEGRFNEHDAQAMSGHGRKENIKATHKILSDRLQDAGVWGIIKQSYQKTMTMWSTGNLGMFQSPNQFFKQPSFYQEHKNKLQFLLVNLTQIVYITVLGAMLIGSVFEMLSPRRNQVLFYELIVLGIYGMHMLFWTVDAHYAYVTFPFLFMMAATGLHDISDLLQQFFAHPAYGERGRTWTGIVTLLIFAIGLGYADHHNRQPLVATPVVQTQTVSSQMVSNYAQHDAIKLTPHHSLSEKIVAKRPFSQLNLPDVASQSENFSVGLRMNRQTVYQWSSLDVDAGTANTLQDPGTYTLRITNRTNQPLYIPATASPYLPLSTHAISGHPHRYLLYHVLNVFNTPIISSKQYQLLFISFAILAIISSLGLEYWPNPDWKEPKLD